ncbi:hypothetical protein IMY05_006G0060800 [Salix suchowensis]|nr:hypothetical protein IMY05_006G0060800 [Salix suchowensis]
MAASIKLLFLLLNHFFYPVTSEPEPQQSRTDDRARELRSKDEKIRQMEKIIHDKSKSIDSLHSEIESLRKSCTEESYALILNKKIKKTGSFSFLCFIWLCYLGNQTGVSEGVEILNLRKGWVPACFKVLIPCLRESGEMWL